MKIFVIGAGDMAESFIKGILQDSKIFPGDVAVINRTNTERLLELQTSYGVCPAKSMAEAETAAMIILAVKPHDVAAVLQQLSEYLHGQVVVSFAAGIPIDFMERLTGGRAQIIRTMPNVPVAVLQGVIAMVTGKNVHDERVEQTKQLLSRLGTVIQLEEQMLDAATAFTGSGPGFVSYFLEAMEDAAVKLGFATEQARALLLQTVIGTVNVLKEWDLSPAQLRERVTSPNGTTQAGLSVLQERGLPTMVATALQQAEQRAREMGEQFTD